MFTFSNRAIRHLAVGGVVLAAISAQPAFAADTAELGISAAVTSTCNVTTLPVAFGNVDVTSGLDTDATGSISVACTAGTTWTAAADEGSAAGATVTARKMAGSGSDLLNYALYTDALRTINFGGANTLTGLGTGVAVPTSVYGRVPAGQTGISSDTYADSVTISLTY